MHRATPRRKTTVFTAALPSKRRRNKKKERERERKRNTDRRVSHRSIRPRPINLVPKRFHSKGSMNFPGRRPTAPCIPRRWENGWGRRGSKKSQRFSRKTRLRGRGFVLVRDCEKEVRGPLPCQARNCAHMRHDAKCGACTQLAFISCAKDRVLDSDDSP